MSFHRFRSLRGAVFIDPAHEILDIVHLLTEHRVKHPSMTLSLQSCSVCIPHCASRREIRATCVYGSDSYGLELKERQCCSIIRDSNKRERRLGYVEDVFVQVMHLRSVGNEHIIIRILGGHRVAMQLAEERIGTVISCAHQDLVDIS